MPRKNEGDSGEQPDPLGRVKEGEWFDIPRVWNLTCCDCGMTHEIEIRLKPGGSLEMSTLRMEKMTGQTRRVHWQRLPVWKRLRKLLAAKGKRR